MELMQYNFPRGKVLTDMELCSLMEVNTLWIMLEHRLEGGILGTHGPYVFF